MANYIDKKEFYQLLVDYKHACAEAESRGLPTPRIPESIGEMFFLLVTNLAKRPNFSGYTFKTDLISDALENCVTACRSFDPEQSDNPFGYFTRISWFAFLRRIEKEKKQTYTKYKAMEHFIIENSLTEEHDVYANFDLSNDKMEPIISKYEKRKKQKPKKDPGLTKLMEDDT